MKTKNILFPAIALLAGTLLCTPAFAQISGDYHDELEGISQNIRLERPTVQKLYLDLGGLYNQMNEDLPIDYDKLFKAASNSIKENKISYEDQYGLMVFAIQTNHNKVLETLFKAGFKANIDEYLEKSDTDVLSLGAVALFFENNEALDLIVAYMPKNYKPKKIKPLEPLRIKQQPQDEYMQRYNYDHAARLAYYPPAKTVFDEIFERLSEEDRADLIKSPGQLPPGRQEELTKTIDSIRQEVLQERGYVIDTVPAATRTIEVENNQDEESGEGDIIGVSYYKNDTLVIKNFDKPLSEAEYQQWLQNNESMVRNQKLQLNFIRK